MGILSICAETVVKGTTNSIEALVTANEVENEWNFVGLEMRKELVRVSWRAMRVTYSCLGR